MGRAPERDRQVVEDHRLSAERGVDPFQEGLGFMVWIWLSVVVILIGAELNAEMEHQTARDTTTGAPKPLGARGARMADTVGAAEGA